MLQCLTEAEPLCDRQIDSSGCIEIVASVLLDQIQLHGLSG